MLTQNKFRKFLGKARELNGSRYSRMDQVKIFKGCLPQILLGPFLNTLTQIWEELKSKSHLETPKSNITRLQPPKCLPNSFLEYLDPNLERTKINVSS